MVGVSEEVSEIGSSIGVSDSGRYVQGQLFDSVLQRAHLHFLPAQLRDLGSQTLEFGNLLTELLKIRMLRIGNRPAGCRLPRKTREFRNHLVQSMHFLFLAKHG